MKLFNADYPLHLFHHGENFKTYELMGAHPATLNKQQGFLFRVWAPRATSVSIIGKPITASTLQFTAQSATTIQIVVLFVIPAIALIAGFAVWFGRRRR